MEQQHGQLRPLRDQFWYNNVASQFSKDLIAIKQDILKYELGLLPKNEPSRCWHVCIHPPTMMEDVAWRSSGTTQSRTIDISYLFIYIVDEPQGWLYKVRRLPSWRTFFDWNYWKNPSYYPVWHTKPGSVNRTIKLKS